MASQNNAVSVAVLKCPQCGAGVTGGGGHVVCQCCGSSLVVTERGAGPELRQPTDAATILRELVVPR